MHRSSSTTRVSDEFFSSSSSSSAPSPGTAASAVSHRLSLDGHASASQLPVFNPSSHAAKREKSRLRSAENAVHLIPLVLVLCAVILWFFSNPVDPMRGSNSTLSGTEKITAAGASGIDGTQNSLLPH